MITITNKGQAASGTYWIAVKKNIDGFIVRSIIRCDEELFNKKENVEGAELKIPQAVQDTMSWE